MHYSHQALTALVVHPQQHEVLALMPEFIVPRDGTEKQDCELAAAKRWIGKKQAWLREQRAFILVCKPSSHELLYQWIEGMEPP